jgi:hypothetical protein
MVLVELEDRNIGLILKYRLSSFEKFWLTSIHPLWSSSPVLQSEDVTLQHEESKSMNKDILNHPYLNHFKQKTEIIKAHVLYHKTSILHVKRERCVWVLDPKELVNEYLRTQDLIQYKCTQLIMRVSKIQNLVQKWSIWVPLRSMPKY